MLNKVEFRYVFPHTFLLKNLFCRRKIPNVKLAGKLKNFTEYWKIISLLEGYTITFHKIYQQKKILNSPKLSQKEKILVQKENHKMLNKRAIIVETPNHLEGELISNVFLIEKKDRSGNPPVINLKHLNQFMPYQHFRIRGLHYLQNILKREDYMCKVHLKDAYFSVPLNPASRTFVQFLWSGKRHEFLYLCFGLAQHQQVLQN